jgi:hypothetical protein
MEVRVTWRSCPSHVRGNHHGSDTEQFGIALHALGEQPSRHHLDPRLRTIDPLAPHRPPSEPKIRAGHFGRQEGTTRRERLTVRRQRRSRPQDARRGPTETHLADLASNPSAPLTLISVTANLPVVLYCDRPRARSCIAALSAVLHPVERRKVNSAFLPTARFGSAGRLVKDDGSAGADADFDALVR